MSRRHPTEVITDLDFFDDLALLTQEIQQAQEITTRLEEEAAYGGFYCNGKKIELQVYNHQIPVEVRVSSGNTLRIVHKLQISWRMDKKSLTWRYATS